MRFPTVTGANLLRQNMTLPYELEGELNLLLVAFYTAQQPLVDSWLPLAEQNAQDNSGFYYYEVPVIQEMNPIAHAIIDEGMRAGIPDPDTRRRTVTLYLDKMAFLQKLGLPDDRNVYILLVDRLGNVHWQASGFYTPETGEELNAFLQRYHLARMHGLDAGLVRVRQWN